VDLSLWIAALASMLLDGSPNSATQLVGVPMLATLVTNRNVSRNGSIGAVPFLNSWKRDTGLGLSFQRDALASVVSVPLIQNA